MKILITEYGMEMQGKRMALIAGLGEGLSEILAKFPLAADQAIVLASICVGIPCMRNEVEWNNFMETLDYMHQFMTEAEDNG